MEYGKTTPILVSGIQFPIKCLFQPSRSKTVESDRFLAEKGLKHSLFLNFFCKTKKMICIENINFWGGNTPPKSVQPAGIEAQTPRSVPHTTPGDNTST